MPADNLLAAMIAGGGENGALFADPNLILAQPEMQLGSGLMQQGASTAPAYPAQALARALSGGIGAGLTKSAVSDLARAYAGSAEGMEGIFPQGTPIGDALRSSNPMVRMAALQQAPKAMLLNSERFGLEPGQESHAMGSPAPTAVSGQPQSPVGKMVQDEQRAAAVGNAPAANAVGSAVTKEISTPEGVPFPPTAAAPRPTGVSATPTAAIAPPEPGAKDQGRVPPAEGPQNAPMTQELAEAKGQQAMYAKASEAVGGQIGEYITAGGKDARNRINALNSIDDALQSGGNNIITGPQSERILHVKQFLDGMGIDTSWVKEGLPMTEVVAKMNAQLASASARAMTGRPTQFEFSAWMKNNPGLLTSKEGTHALIDILRQSSQQDIDLGNLAMNKKNWDNWGDVVSKYYNDHGLKSPFTGKPMAQENPSATAAAAAPQLPQGVPPAAQRKPGLYPTPKGNLYWNGSGWLPPTAQQ